MPLCYPPCTAERWNKRGTHSGYSSVELTAISLRHPGMLAQLLVPVGLGAALVEAAPVAVKVAVVPCCACCGVTGQVFPRTAVIHAEAASGY